ncbi:hypothetical protein P691DRAFT_783429 [Macrolepiota fuliginosa MF-IS2]|uniref:Uncharacterized protein n=1 Tax=Macrolepiota fuliginosa MF-IS2 TaxID=1400762 RepID=A0A9P5XAY7_9AGAR|nr:hypothetical protein P691DRAFT_783429 [Macrolepiota fuliginosa MF-IS2]
MYYRQTFMLLMSDILSIMKKSCVIRSIIAQGQEELGIAKAVRTRHVGACPTYLEPDNWSITPDRILSKVHLYWVAKVVREFCGPWSECDDDLSPPPEATGGGSDDDEEEYSHNDENDVGLGAA